MSKILRASISVAGRISFSRKSIIAAYSGSLLCISWVWGFWGSSFLGELISQESYGRLDKQSTLPWILPRRWTILKSYCCKSILLDDCLRNVNVSTSFGGWRYQHSPKIVLLPIASKFGSQEVNRFIQLCAKFQLPRSFELFETIFFKSSKNGASIGKNFVAAFAKNESLYRRISTKYKSSKLFWRILEDNKRNKRENRGNKTVRIFASNSPCRP